MEEKKVKLSTLFLILALIIIIVMGVFIFMLYKDKEAEVKKSSELQTQVNSLNGTVSQLQEKIKTISETVNTSAENKPEETNTTTENQSKTSSEQKTYNYTDLEEFWTNFRSAVLSYDFNEMKKYVKFPLKETKGDYSTIQTVDVNEEEFEESFKEFLNKYDGKALVYKAESTVFNWIRGAHSPILLSGLASEKSVEFGEGYNYFAVHITEDGNSANFDGMTIEKDNDGYWRLTNIDNR